MKRCISPSLVPRDTLEFADQSNKRKQPSEPDNLELNRSISPSLIERVHPEPPPLVEREENHEARRRRNLEIWGGSTAQEADVVRILKETLAKHGVEVLVLNDYTKADILVRPLGSSDDDWLPVQVKTTKGPRPPKPDSSVKSWRFSNVSGYESMPVLLCVVSSRERWLADGSIFKCKDVDFSAGSKYVKQSLNVVEDYVLSCALLEAHAGQQFVNTKEWDARWNIQRKTHLIELQSLVLWIEHVCTPQGWMYRWPDGQGLSHDLEISRDAGELWTRVQFKTVQKYHYAGFSLPLMHQAGYNSNGKPTHKPYSIGDADEYIGMTWNSDVFDVWSFTESELTPYLSSGSSNGKVRLSVHLPAELEPLHVNDGRPGSKGGPLNRTIWTRSNHMRYYRVH